MTTTPDYPEFLISAIDEENAQAFAITNGLDEGSWFRIPSTLDDATEAFKKEATPVLSKSEWSRLSEDEVKERSLTGYYNTRILFAQDFFAAAKYAAKRNWWLHSWKFIADSEAEEVIEYGFYC